MVAMINTAKKMTVEATQMGLDTPRFFPLGHSEPQPRMAHTSWGSVSSKLFLLGWVSNVMGRYRSLPFFPLLFDTCRSPHGLPQAALAAGSQLLGPGGS